MQNTRISLHFVEASTEISKKGLEARPEREMCKVVKL
jgi:hypothetical protein